MLRRTFLAGGMSAALGASAQTDAPAGALRVAAREAFLYALPVVEIANVRAGILGKGAPVGRLIPQRGLATAKDRFVTTPNADTVYATGFIDLRHGPVKIILPPLGGRYGSLSLMDMFSNNIAVLGTRTTGPDGGAFTLVGPSDAGPADAIRSPTPWVWALARVLVNGPTDTTAAQAELARFVIESSSAPSTWAPGARRTGPWQDWMKAANALLLENPPLATDRRILRAMSPLGLGTPEFDPAKFSAAGVAEITAGMSEARQSLVGAGMGNKRVGEWLYPPADMGVFFQDYATRARIAIAGLAALPTSEAMYLAAIPPKGRAFDGDGLWRLHFSADGLPPVDGFWSLTLYEAEPDGSFFLTENAINRYSIGDRTQGLAHDENGALDIWISRNSPGAERAPNWLPAPTKGPFILILRTYLPREPLIAQTYVPPAVELI